MQEIQTGISCFWEWSNFWKLGKRKSFKKIKSIISKLERRNKTKYVHHHVKWRTRHFLPISSKLCILSQVTSDVPIAWSMMSLNPNLLLPPFTSLLPHWLPCFPLYTPTIHLSYNLVLAILSFWNTLSPDVHMAGSFPPLIFTQMSPSQ